MNIFDFIFAHHCNECGAKCTRIFTGGYESDGKPAWIYACPTRLKGHAFMDDCRLYRLDKSGDKK